MSCESAIDHGLVERLAIQLKIRCAARLYNHADRVRNGSLARRWQLFFWVQGTFFSTAQHHFLLFVFFWLMRKWNESFHQTLDLANPIPDRLLTAWSVRNPFGK